MKVLGLVTEYNPFHNGHFYHINQSKAISGADYVVCVMSGNFIQRGEPALVNKWARTRMALSSGVDLVIELPLVYAMSSAEQFAYGGVKLLDSLGVVDNICFGSESGKIDELDSLASILFKEPLLYKTKLKEALKEGNSFAVARENALSSYLKAEIEDKDESKDVVKNENKDKAKDDDISSLLATSNNILGIEYLKALKKLKSKIIPLTIERTGNSHICETITGSISSATSIRCLLSETKELHNKNIKIAIPKSTFKILEEEFKQGRGPVTSQCFDGIILSKLRSMSEKDIKRLPYVCEGLENRIKKAADIAGTYEELVDIICTKRYARTRIQRILFSILTNLTVDDFEIFNTAGGPQYIKVLGFNKKGRELLSIMKKQATLPVIIKAADFKCSSNPMVSRLLEIESFATDMYVLGYSNSSYRKAGQEFTSNLVIDPT